MTQDILYANIPLEVEMPLHIEYERVKGKDLKLGDRIWTKGYQVTIEFIAPRGDGFDLRLKGNNTITDFLLQIWVGKDETVEFICHARAS